ncbi:MAG: ATP-binding protein [bacterium]
MPLKKLGELSIPSSQDYLPQVDSFVEKLLKATKFPKDDLDDVAISVSEAVNNAILHGNQSDESKKVFIKVYLSKKYIRISVRDEGGGFKPERVPDPTEDENLLKASGRGLLIMQHLMDRLAFKPTSKGTEIILDKFCPEGC